MNQFQGKTVATSLRRRAFLTAATAMTMQRGSAQAPSIPIIDTHIHFFDTTRPQGVPYGNGFPVGPDETIAPPELGTDGTVPSSRDHIVGVDNGPGQRGVARKIRVRKATGQK